MNPTTLKEFLVSTIVEELAAGAAAMPDRPSRGGLANSGLSDLANQIADDLVNEAIASGLPLTRHQVEKSRLSGGNTAELVAQVTLHAPFVFKFDQVTRKLAEEGAAMRRIKRNEIPGIDLPERFRNAWPQLYGLRQQAPFAYLMEFFPPSDHWLSLEDRLFPGAVGSSPGDSDAVRWIGSILDLFFSGFTASVDPRRTPNLMTDYLDRIRGRLEDAAKLEPRFASRQLVVNGLPLQPWKHYLTQIERHESFLNEITPGFTTVVHGDPNPGNIMLRTTTAEVEIKFIDPKEWITGDYLFDITKLTHFLEGTGPIEKPAQGPPPEAVFAHSGGEGTLDYSIERLPWVEPLVKACRDRVQQFARQPASQDPHWEARYELGMAANLLGLPVGRLTKNPPRVHAATILFGEGLTWLDRFFRRLSASAFPSA